MAFRSMVSPVFSCQVFLVPLTSLSCLKFASRFKNMSPHTHNRELNHRRFLETEFNEEMRQATVITCRSWPGKCIDQEPAYLQLSCLISYLLYFSHAYSSWIHLDLSPSLPLHLKHPIKNSMFA